MGVSIQCGKCGHENALGRVFCGQCSARLDMSQISAQVTNAGAHGRHKLARLVRIGVPILLLLAALGGGVLALLPPPIVGEKATRRAGQEADRKTTSMLRAMTIGPTLALNQKFTEGEVNGYFVYHPQPPGTFVTTDLRNGSAIIQAVRTVTLGERVQLPVVRSLEVVVTDTGLVVKRASLGRLPMPGPLQAGVVRAVKAQILASFQHPKVLGFVQHVTLRTDELDVTVGRAP